VEIKELIEDQAAALERRRRAPRRRFNFPLYSAEEKRRRRCHRRKCRMSLSVGAGVEQVDGGAGSLFFWSGGGAQGTEERRKKTMVWGKNERFYPRHPIYTSPSKGHGGGSAPLSRPFLR
jgi:hypothetical protein